MERHFDEELKKLNTNIIRMAAMTEKAIHNSIEALKNRDKDLARAVIKDDMQIDEMENNNEEHIVEILALFQPMAGDLRFLTIGMQVNSELERIADLTENICYRVLDIADQPLLKPLVDIPKLGEQAKKMVRNSIDAFVKKDENLAKEVILSDKYSNELRSTIIKKLVEDYIVKDGTTAYRAIPLLLIARDLERMCDHAASIAEDVIYMVQARIIRHHRERLSTIEVEDEKR